MARRLVQISSKNEAGPGQQKRGGVVKRVRCEVGRRAGIDVDNREDDDLNQHMGVDPNQAMHGDEDRQCENGVASEIIIRNTVVPGKHLKIKPLDQLPTSDEINRPGNQN